MIQLVELTYSLKEARNKNQKEMHQDYAKFLVWYYFKHSADFVSTYNILCPWLYALEVRTQDRMYYIYVHKTYSL